MERARAARLNALAHCSLESCYELFQNAAPQGGRALWHQSTSNLCKHICESAFVASSESDSSVSWDVNTACRLRPPASAAAHSRMPTTLAIRLHLRTL